MTVANVGATLQSPVAQHAGNRWRDGQPIDRKPPDNHVEVGQDRGLASGGPRPGDFRQHRHGDAQGADVKPVGQPFEGPPVELRAGSGEDQPLRIMDAHVTQHRFPVQRSIDPPDGHAHAVRRAGGIDPVGYPAMADIGVDDPRGGDHHAGQYGNRPRQPAPPAHQNACPSDTYTAIRESPGWGFSGVPTSTRIGPKLL